MLHEVCRAKVVIRLGFVFLQATAFDVFEQGVKIFLNPVISHHVFYNLVVVNVIVVFLRLLGRNLNYDPATRLLKVIAD